MVQPQRMEDDMPPAPITPQAAADERELVIRAQRYEPEALEEIYDTYFDAVYRAIFARVGDHTVAEAVTGQAFLTALEILPKYHRRPGGLHPWLQYLAARELRAHGWRPTPGRHPVHEADELRGALAELTPDQQEVLTMRFLVGMPVEAVAAGTGRRRGQVRALQHRALQALLRLLAARDAA
ncbi:MAG: hypothetical protein E6J02_01405 [Chloroflexi bacterium]|nr:MAG: hypothetical protein E6J02_01405 [Chloroflexota bacterium]TME16819.1 MAG: hypothetical protein E6I70_11705 [Chloroflexota bacterium]